VVLPYRAPPEQVAEVERVAREEGITRSAAVELLVGHGIDVYRARGAHGARLDSLAERRGEPSVLVLIDVIGAGLVVHERSAAKPAAPRKPSARRKR
jgi:hypothetical protein